MLVVAGFDYEKHLFSYFFNYEPLTKLWTKRKFCKRYTNHDFFHRMAKIIVEKHWNNITCAFKLESSVATSYFLE